MRDLTVATAQFEPRDRDKAFNLGRIETLTAEAVTSSGGGAEIVSFHECCISGYTFLQTLSRDELAAVAEPVPDGPSTKALIDIARKHQCIVMAGLVEIDGERVYNCYVTVGPRGYITKFRKLHPFVNRHLWPGEGYNVVDLGGVKAGFLICYDNNLPENTRCTTLLGAEVIFAPHVTGCVASTMPGRGTVPRKLWDERHTNPGALRAEFASMKARAWLLRWLPARAWENGVYIVFSNNIGVDHDTIKPGCAMVLDPFGDIVAEAASLGDEVVAAKLTADKLELASGRRYIRARRPDLYGPLVAPNTDARTDPGWTVKSER